MSCAATKSVQSSTCSCLARAASLHEVLLIREVDAPLARLEAERKSNPTYRLCELSAMLHFSISVNARLGVRPSNRPSVR